jgi:hypothetical protein
MEGNYQMLNNDMIDPKLSQQVHEVLQRFLDDLSRLEGPPRDIAMLITRSTQGWRGREKLMTVENLAKEITRRCVTARATKTIGRAG